MNENREKLVLKKQTQDQFCKGVVKEYIYSLKKKKTRTSAGIRSSISGSRELRKGKLGISECACGAGRDCAGEEQKVKRQSTKCHQTHRSKWETESAENQVRIQLMEALYSGMQVSMNIHLCTKWWTFALS